MSIKRYDLVMGIVKEVPLGRFMRYDEHREEIDRFETALQILPSLFPPSERNIAKAACARIKKLVYEHGK